MSAFEKWEIESEAAARFWAAVITLEEAWRYILQWRFRKIQKRIQAQYKELPPVVHAGHVWGEL